jgi:hypothetical protein
MSARPAQHKTMSSKKVVFTEVLQVFNAVEGEPARLQYMRWQQLHKAPQRVNSFTRC